MSDKSANSGREPIEYVLGGLSDEERHQFEERLGRDPGLRETVAETESLVASLRSLPGDSWEPVEPPPFQVPVNGRDRLPAKAGAPDPAPEALPRSAPRRRPISGWRIPIPAIAAGAMALLAVGVAVGAILGGDGSSTDSPAIVASSALRPVDPAGSGARGKAQVVDAGDSEQSLSVSVADMPATPPGRYYEVWLMSGRGKLISLGGFRVGDGGRRAVDVPLPVDPKAYRLIDVSLERTDGNPGHSAVSLLRGPT